MPKDFFQPIFDAIGSFLGSEIVQLGFRAIAIYWVVLWLAAAYWAFRDIQLRSENPFLPYVAAAFIIVFTPLLFPFAVFVYRVMRPQERLGDVYERNLAEEALLAEVEAIQHCPTCNRRVHDEWIICPTCRTRLHRVCPNCSRLVGLDWSLCAWCGKDFEHHEAPAPMATRTEPSSPSSPSSPAPTAAIRPSVRGGSPQRPPRPARSSSVGSSTDPLPER